MKYKNFEDFLRTNHMEDHPSILDDDLPDAYEDWLGNLDGEDFIKYSDGYAEYVKNPHKLIEGVKVSAFLYKDGEPIEDSSLITLVIKKGDIIGKSEVNNCTYIYREGKEYEFYGYK